MKRISTILDRIRKRPGTVFMDLKRFLREGAKLMALAAFLILLIPTKFEIENCREIQ